MDEPIEDIDNSCSVDTESQVTAHQQEDTRDVKHKQDLKKAARRTWFIALLVVMMGAAASGCFLYVGISSAQHQEQDRFDRHAHDLSKEITSSWRDYVTAAQWIHEACRDWRGGSYTRADFRVLYNYIIAGGLDFFLAEWVPNITHVERPALEAEAASYYASDANVEYKGFVGIEPNPNDPEEIGLFPRTQQPFYFPIHFLEPYERIGEAEHLDLYSIIYERVAIETAIEKAVPVLTERFTIVSQETYGYSVSLIHPGVPLPDDIYVEPRDLSLILIHIRSLLARAARFQGVSLAVYLYDATKTKVDGSPEQFLGGAEIKMVDDNERELNYYSEVELENVRKGAGLIYEDDMEVGTRAWTIVVVPVDDTYEPSFLFAILCGFLIFAASLLLALVWIMHNRQRSHQVKEIIAKTSAESAIVSSLFPAAVRDRLIQQSTSSAKQSEYDASTTRHDDAFENDRKGSNMIEDADLNTTSVGIYGSLPIAEEYHNTTIMFADLAGFTAWSSSREPTQVFCFLETIYHAFDMIAKKRRVFKVETVGDCYVAVAGLPTPRKDHAVVMVRFANNCLRKVHELLASLQETFGPDTGNLGFRVGLHSGSVTAGVLRGQKGRFQLFGDTMNTASRMESTGVTDKIHVSQETAELLIAAGFQKWLTPREGEVNVKGKGSLQTYFATVDAYSQASSHETGSITSEPDCAEWDAEDLVTANEVEEELRHLEKQLQKHLHNRIEL